MLRKVLIAAMLITAATTTQFIAAAPSSAAGTGELDWITEVAPQSNLTQLAVLDDGTSVAAGIVYSFTGGFYTRLALSAVDADGNLLWEKLEDSFDFNFTVTDVVALAEGGFMVVGRASPFSDAFSVTVLGIKYDVDGNALGSAGFTYPGSFSNPYTLKVKGFADGGFVASHDEFDFNDFAASSTVLDFFSGEGAPAGSAVTPLHVSSYYDVVVNGDTVWTVDSTDAARRTYQVTKFDRHGAVLVSKTATSAATIFNYKAAVTTDGGVTVVNTDFTKAADEMAVVSVFSPAGELIDESSLPHRLYSGFYAITATAEGGVVVTNTDMETGLKLTNWCICANGELLWSSETEALGATYYTMPAETAATPGGGLAVLGTLGTPSSSLAMFSAETASVIAVKVDIQPGNALNVLNPKKNGVVTVAVLSSADFDAPAMIDPSTAVLAGAPATGKAKAKDVNADGLDDLVLKVDGSMLSIEPGSVEAAFSAKTLSGMDVSGADYILIVGK